MERPLLCSVLPLAWLALLLADQNPHNYEVLHTLERARMLKVAQQYHEANISVDVFYHVSSWQPFWKEVVTEQLHMLDGHQLVRGRKGALWTYTSKKTTPNVGSIARKITILFHGNEEEVRMMKDAVKTCKVDFLHKVSFLQSAAFQRTLFRDSKPDDRPAIRAAAEKDGATAGEYPTIEALHQHCKRQVAGGDNGVVLYIHNKGACCRKGEAPQSDWRDLMNTVNIEFASVCLRALYDGYSACGAEYQDMHFSGNFWWAACNHVAMLPPLWDPINNAWEAEFFLFNVSKSWEKRDPFGVECAYRPFHCRVNHYHNHCPRGKYVGAISSLLATDVLPFVGYHGEDEPTYQATKKVWRDQQCLSTRSTPTQMSEVVPYYSRTDDSRRRHLRDRGILQ